MNFEDTSSGRSLDSRAWSLIVLTLVLMGLSLLLRSYTHQWALDQRIFGVSADSQQQVWISLPDALVVTSVDGGLRQRLAWDELGSKYPLFNWVWTRDRAWARDADGKVFVCQTLGGLRCQTALYDAPTLDYATLAAHPNGEDVVLLENGTGMLYRYAGQSGRLLDTISNYRFGELDFAASGLKNDLKKLYKANNSVQIDDAWVVANTGFHRLDQWPIQDGQIDWQASPKTILSTEGQPYAMAKMGDTWLVLEGGATLKNGWLNQYVAGRASPQEILLPLTDPVSMAQIGQQVFLSDQAQAQMARVMVDPQTGAASASPWSSVDLNPLFQKINQQHQIFWGLTQSCLVLLLLFPALLLWWLKKQGYDLNQSL